MSYASSLEYSNSARRAEVTRSLAANIESASRMQERYEGYLRAPGANRDYELGRIKSQEAHINEMKSTLSSLRSKGW